MREGWNGETDWYTLHATPDFFCFRYILVCCGIGMFSTAVILREKIIQRLNSARGKFNSFTASLETENKIIATKQSQNTVNKQHYPTHNLLSKCNSELLSSISKTNTKNSKFLHQSPKHCFSHRPENRTVLNTRLSAPDMSSKSVSKAVLQDLSHLQQSLKPTVSYNLISGSGDQELRDLQSSSESELTHKTDDSGNEYISGDSETEACTSSPTRDDTAPSGNTSALLGSQEERPATNTANPLLAKVFRRIQEPPAQSVARGCVHCGKHASGESAAAGLKANTKPPIGSKFHQSLTSHCK